MYIHYFAIEGTYGLIAESGSQRLLEVIESLASVVIAREQMQPTFNYSPSKITVDRSDEFRKAALRDYGYTKDQVSGRDPLLPCLILDRPVPKQSLVVGHIFKHEWAPGSQAFMGINIDDTRNALPLFKPLEDAFDRLQLCIAVEE